uniref:Ion_trans domain-containing protein n=1 Tax=Macrostomum lignano TaxID=282301 RepID=A0A1I8F2F7_9PLAT
ILTQEDWNTVLYNGMARTSPWAALYFIALMTFGNYVLFNLLVAILVEGFSSEKAASSVQLNSVHGADSGLGPGSDAEDAEDGEPPDTVELSKRRLPSRLFGE